jgi:hypothetical protein
MERVVRLDPNGYGYDEWMKMSPPNMSN